MKTLKEGKKGIRKREREKKRKRKGIPFLGIFICFEDVFVFESRYLLEDFDLHKLLQEGVGPQRRSVSLDIIIIIVVFDLLFLLRHLQHLIYC